ncbi:hypothetical protein ACVWXO_001150 [Bradyrhizobium sp. LM2.7]
MKHSLLAPVLLSLTCLSFTAVPQKSAPAAQVDDPFLWLEEIEAPRAVARARAENDKTLGVLQSDPHNGRFYEEALSMLHAKDRIPYVSLERRGLSDFCRDEKPCARHLAAVPRPDLMAVRTLLVREFDRDTKVVVTPVSVFRRESRPSAGSTATRFSSQEIGEKGP